MCSMCKNSGVAEFFLFGVGAAEVVGILAIPVSCGVMWCGKKTVALSHDIDPEKHLLGRTCLKVMGYAMMTLGLLVGAAGSILVGVTSCFALGMVGTIYGGPVGYGIGIAVGVGLGLAGAYKVGRVFLRSLCQLSLQAEAKLEYRSLNQPSGL